LAIDQIRFGTAQVKADPWQYTSGRGLPLTICQIFRDARGKTVPSANSELHQKI